MDQQEKQMKNQTYKKWNWPIILEYHNPKLNNEIQCWRIFKCNWEELKKNRRISEAYIDNEEHMPF